MASVALADVGLSVSDAGVLASAAVGDVGVSLFVAVATFGDLG